MFQTVILVLFVIFMTVVAIVCFNTASINDDIGWGLLGLFSLLWAYAAMFYISNP